MTQKPPGYDAADHVRVDPGAFVLTTSATPPLATQQESTAPAVVEQPILLDLASVRLLLDALGAIALFVTATVALSIHEAVAVTAAVGILVLGARGFRRLARRSLPSRDVRDQSVTF
ncbi:hypothetical protein RhoFasB10_00862 [Rhodococcus sp. B10]|nr:hypothetical protein [Rhodococcus sp. B10]